MSIFDTFLNYRVFVETLPLILSGLMTTLTLGLHLHRARLRRGLVLALVRLYAPRPVQLPGHRLYRRLPLHPGPGAAVRRLLRAALRRHPPVVLRVGGDARSRWCRPPIRPRSSAPASRRSRTASSRRRGRSGCTSVADDGQRGPAAGDPHRHPAADLQLHQRDEGHRARLGRRHARPAEAGDPGAGAGRQPDAADRRGGHLSHHPAAAGPPRRAAGKAPCRRPADNACREALHAARSRLRALAVSGPRRTAGPISTMPADRRCCGPWPSASRTTC